MQQGLRSRVLGLQVPAQRMYRIAGLLPAATYIKLSLFGSA